MAAITRIAAVLGASVVVEGVETEVQKASLLASDVGYLQGFLFNQPMASAEITRLFISHELGLTMPSVTTPQVSTIRS
jgi:EAL domain-containing protein (putative c-di-GMP-specific phosphodiesterase class I)